MEANERPEAVDRCWRRKNVRPVPIVFGLLSVTHSTWAQEPVHFVDPNLKFWVEARLHISDPSPEDMLGLTSHTWVRDEATSACVDAGDPSDGVRYEPSPTGDVINMGAYGGTGQASLSHE